MLVGILVILVFILVILEHVVVLVVLVFIRVILAVILVVLVVILVILVVILVRGTTSRNASITDNITVTFECFSHVSLVWSLIFWSLTFEPLEKTGLRGFRPSLTQTGLYSHRRWLGA